MVFGVERNISTIFHHLICFHPVLSLTRIRSSILSITLNIPIIIHQAPSNLQSTCFSVTNSSSVAFTTSSPTLRPHLTPFPPSPPPTPPSTTSELSPPSIHPSTNPPPKHPHRLSRPGALPRTLPFPFSPLSSTVRYKHPHTPSGSFPPYNSELESNHIIPSRPAHQRMGYDYLRDHGH